MNSNELNRATKYLKCVKNHCKPKKTKKKIFKRNKCSDDVECGNNIAALQECIDGVKRESMNKVVGKGEYNVPNKILRNQVRGIYKTHRTKKNPSYASAHNKIGTYHVGKQTSKPNYVDMKEVKNRGLTGYVDMELKPKLKPRPPEPLPRVLDPPKTIKKSSPHIYASVRKTRTSKKSNPNFYAVTGRQGPKPGSPLKKTGAKKPTVAKKPKLGKVAQLRKVFEQ